MKKILIGSLLIMILMVSGCAISDYLTGAGEKPFSLLPEKESAKDEAKELDNMTEDLEKVDEAEKTEPEKEKPIVITVKEAEIVNLKPKAKDADEDKIVYSFSEPLDENGRWETSYGDAGEYLIVVTASDGKLETSKKVLLIVERVNVPPVISGIPDEVTVDEGDTLVLSPEAKDPNGDDVELTISEPVGNDGEWVIGYQDAGEYFVEIKATDGELESVKKVLVTVKKKNVAPVITNVMDLEVYEGETVIISPVITDLNGDEIKLTISDPVGDDGTWETTYTDHGTYNIVIKADDGTVVTTEEITVKVNDINVAPVIEDIVQESE